jgi:hypothetical protein
MKISFITVRKQNVKRLGNQSRGKEYIVKDGDVMHFRFNVVSRKLNNIERNLQVILQVFFDQSALHCKMLSS